MGSVFPIGKMADCSALFFPIGKTSPHCRAIFPIGKMADRTKIQPVRVKSSIELGNVVRDVRTRNALDQAGTADLVGVGPRFLGELERGKPNLRLGLVLKVLERLGLELWVSPRGWKP